MYNWSRAVQKLIGEDVQALMSGPKAKARRLTRSENISYFFKFLL